MQPIIWILDGGIVGHRIQAIGVAEEIARHYKNTRIIEKSIDPNFWQRLVAPRGMAKLRDIAASSLPDILIVCGTHTAPYARYIKKHHPKTFVVVLQNPRTPLQDFDFVWIPEHDGVCGDNVFTTLTAPHAITQQKIKQQMIASQDWAIGLPDKRVAVLLGGNSKSYYYETQDIERLGDRLQALSEKGWGLMITASRRTSKKMLDIIESKLKVDSYRCWKGGEYNPYPGILGLADAVIVTADSVNMIGEACMSERGVYVFYPEYTPKSSKFFRFHQRIGEESLVMPLVDEIETIKCGSINSTVAIAVAIIRSWNP